MGGARGSARGRKAKAKARRASSALVQAQGLGGFGSCAQGQLRGVSALGGDAGGKTNHWGKLAQFEAAAFDEQKEMARAAVREQIREQRRFLDQQRELATAAREQMRAKAQEEAAHMLEEVRKWGEEERVKQKRAAEQNRRIKDMLTTQRAELVRRKAADMARRKAEEAAEVKEVKEALDTERRKKEARREKELREMTVMRQENEARLEQRRLAAQAEKERDTRMAAEYVALLDKQEADRTAKLRAQTERVERLMNLGSEAVRDRAERESAQDNWIAKAAAEQLEREQAAERRRRERAQNATIDQLRGLDAQMDEKRRFMEEDARTEALWKAEVLRQDEDDRLKEERKQRQRRQAALRNRADIEAQIAEHNTRTATQEIAMTSTEQALNSALLEAASLVTGAEA